MKVVTRKALLAWDAKEPMKHSNTEVRIENGNPHLYLFGNEIAKIENGETWISQGGWRASRTTQQRLTSMFKIRLRKLKDSFVVNEQFIWDGEWLNIDRL